MEVIEQIAAVVPYGENVLHKAEDVYGYSKDRTMQVYNKTKSTVIQTRRGYLQFRKNLKKTIDDIIKQTVNEVLTRFENLIGVDSKDKSSEQMAQARERVQAMFQTIFREHILRSRVVTNDRVQQVLKMGRKYSVQYMVPLYITMRATMIVTKEMLIEFLESRLRDIKLTYDTGKDTVTMFVAGNFNQDNLKKKVFEGIDLFKKFTIRVVNKGLQIKVDRQSLVENYDKFAVNFLEVVKQMRDKSETLKIEAKRKSRDLYKDVVARIRAKQLEIRTCLRQQMPKLLNQSE